MMTRRHLLALSTAALVLCKFELPAQAQSADQATAFVKQTGAAMVGVVNGPGNAEDKRSRLAAIIERTVDVDGVARFCLGRFWRTATPEQQQAYLRLFHRVLETNITGHLGEYSGVGFSMTRTQPFEGSLAVGTIVTRPNSAPADVKWLVGDVGGQLRIIDVIAEGTSLRLTQRSDYASFLARNGNDVQKLIDAMRRQTGLT